MKEQPSYNPQFLQGGFAPDRAPDFTVGMQENFNRINAAHQANLQQMIADKSTIAKNSEMDAQGIRELSKFSQTLNKVVQQAAFDKADDDYAEGQMYAFQQGMDVGQPDEGVATPKAAGDAVEANPGNADVVLPAMRGSRFFQMGVANAQGGMALGGYQGFVDQYVQKRNPTNSAEYAAAQAEATKEWFKQVDISKMSKGYLRKSFYPQLAKQQAASIARYREQAAQLESESISIEANAQFNTTKDLGNYLTTMRATVDGNGDPLGYSGAWNKAVANITEGVKNGTITEADIREMESQPIPGDPKGRTFGELHSNKFATIRKAAMAQRRQDWNNQQADRQMAFEQEEQKLVDAFLDPSDKDGYTDAQIEEAQDAFMEKYGKRSKKLDTMLAGSVDGKTRKKQEEQIEDLIGLGLLTPERLSKFDRKLQKKYMSTAQQQAKTGKNPANKEALEAIDVAVRRGPEGQSPISVVPGQGKSVTISLMQVKMKQYYQRKVTEYAAGGNPDPITAARDDTLEYFNRTAKVDKNGYVGVIASPSAVQSQRIINANRLADINDTLKQEGSIDKEFAFYDEAQLNEMSKGYGKPGFTLDPSLTYIGQKLGLDPLAVLNRQRKAAKMNELPPTPALEIIQQELTPAQRAALNNIGTAEVSTRTMGAVAQANFRPELVPNGYGPMVQKAASSAGIQPAMVAAMAEIESNWNPGVPSYNNSSFGLMQINRAAHPQFFANNDWKNPQASLDYGAKFFASLVKRYNGDLRAAAMAYNAGPAAYDEYAAGKRYNDAKEREMINHANKFMKTYYKYGGGSSSLQSSATMRPTLAYISGNIGPTSTGPHLDVKQVGGGRFEETALDQFVEVDDPEFGRVSLGEIRKRTGGIGDNFDQHVARGSHGIDYGLHSGTKIYVKNGAKVVGSTPSAHGDVVTIQTPDGQQYTFLHGTKG